jgi:ribosome-associated translation inhibitor RaiA
MQTQPQITFRHMDSSPALEETLLKKIEKLEEFCKNIIGCHVIIELPHAHHHQGKLFHVAIDIKVPGEEIVINRNHPQDPAHSDVKVAVRDAFDAAKRKLHDYVERQRG